MFGPIGDVRIGNDFVKNPPLHPHESDLRGHMVDIKTKGKSGSGWWSNADNLCRYPPLSDVMHFLPKITLSNAEGWGTFPRILANQKLLIPKCTKATRAALCADGLNLQSLSTGLNVSECLCALAQIRRVILWQMKWVGQDEMKYMKY